MSLAPPPADALAALLAGVTSVYRRVDIYEEDGETPWLLDVPAADGSVSVDGTRSERRVLDLVLGNPNNAIQHGVDGLWYDKIVKPYRGVYYLDEDGERQRWEVPLGEFIVDDLTSQNFPHSITVKGRDYTMKLLDDKLTASTTFVAGQPIESLVRTLAVNGGISKFLLPSTGRLTGKDFTFEKGTTRWQAINDLAVAYSYEVFFDANGYLVMREFEDPATSPEVFCFTTDSETGTLVKWTKNTNQARIYNQIIVYGNTDGASLPVHAVAENRDPNSPTSIPRLGRTKSYEYTSSFITETEQAEEVASNFLKVHSLEAYTLGLESLVLPWLDVNEVVGFVVDGQPATDPTRFLMDSFTIPLRLGTMAPQAKRVQIVG